MMAKSIETLLNSSDEEFRSIVDDEVRHPNNEYSALLRDPRVRERWYYALVGMKKSVESQLSAKRSDILKTPASPQDVAWQDFHRWKAGAVRFKSGVEDRLLEIRKNGGRPSDRANLLQAAILQHKNAVLKDFNPEEVSDADTSLWKSVDR